MGERGFWGVAALLTLAVIGSAAYKFYSANRQLPVVQAALVTDCDLHQSSCSGALPHDGNVALSITPRPIPAVKPLHFVVDLPPSGARAVTLDFSGVDMNMGVNRYQLVRTAAGRYEGEGMLPVCVRSRMLWEVKVLIDRGDAIFAVPYRFETGVEH